MSSGGSARAVRGTAVTQVAEGGKAADDVTGAAAGDATGAAAGAGGAAGWAAGEAEG